jgi:hypothetical protein
MTKEIELSDKRLEHLESVIKKYRRDFYSVGKALKEIRDGRHYQTVAFTSFESYVRLRWDMGRSHAYRLIEAFTVIENLSPIGEQLPKNEAQVRPLTQLDPHSQRRVWRDFLATGKPISTLNIKKFVAVHLGKQTPQKPFREIISKQYQAAVRAMLGQIDIARNGRWQQTSQRTALYWNKIMKDKIRWG